MVHLFQRKPRPASTPTISSPTSSKPTSSRPYSPPFRSMLVLLQRRPLSAYTSPSTWGGGQPTSSGAIQMPYNIPTAAQEDFRQACIAWSREGFDWPAWANTREGKNMLEGKEGSIEGANVEEIGALCTAMLRSDRFCEGAFAGYCEKGMAERVIKRVQVLWTEQHEREEKGEWKSAEDEQGWDGPEKKGRAAGQRL